MTHPSSRRIARKISQEGRSVSHETINRWRRQGWRALDREPRHPLEIARDHLDDAVPLLTGEARVSNTMPTGPLIKKRHCQPLSASQPPSVGPPPAPPRTATPNSAKA
jgi:hypothetical protein